MKIKITNKQNTLNELSGDATPLSMPAAMKIHIASVSPDPVKKPFNAYYGISGTGLMRDEDLPGTFYKLLKRVEKLIRSLSQTQVNHGKAGGP